MKIVIDVINQKLKMESNSYRYISESRNFIYIIFNLDNDWDGMSVCADFTQGSNVYSHPLDNNNGVYFPSSIEPGICEISLIGSKDGVTATTDSITLYVDQYSGSDGDVITTYFVDTSEGNVTEDDIPVGNIAFSNGVTLPEMSNEAIEDEVFLGKEYIDGDGVKRTGKFTIDEELTEQDTLIAQITNALRNKAANNDPAALPELGDTAAQPTDMVVGKVLYDDEGNPVTGTLIEADEIQEKLFATSDYAFGGTPGGTVFHVSGMYNGNLEGVVVRPGAGLGVRSAPTDFFGNAEAADVVLGKTFTSAAGLLVEGTHECEEGVTLPELDNPAEAADIASGKTLYDDEGNPVTGEVSTFDKQVGWMVDPQQVGGKINLSYYTTKPYLFRAGVVMESELEKFGDAMPEQVVKGVKFTSKAGLLAEGTMEPSSGGVEMHVDGETLFITGAASIKNETLIL